MASSTTDSATATHILVIPFPAQGHMASLLDLTHHLLTHGGGCHLTITVAVTPKNLPFLQPLLARHPSTAISALTLPFPTHPSLPSGEEHTNDLPPSSFPSIFSALPGLNTPLLRWFSSHPSPPSALISDMFLGWTHQLASQLGIKRFVFSPSGSFALSTAISLLQHFPHLPDDENGVVSVTNVPGEPEFPCWQLLMTYKAYANPNPFRTNQIDNIASWGFVVNTFTALEHAYLDHMKSLVGHDRVWAVGPLFLPDDEVGSRLNVSNGSDPVADKALSWLDTCGDAEVVYVSFGSLAMLTQEQIDVLAVGLEKSGVRFVWKLKEPSIGHVDGQAFGKLPLEFEDRVAGRGLVITQWIPQVLILKHRAVGSFLTHCGWNSILEGLTTGVMLLTWPLGEDQFWNAKLVVDTLKVGVGVGRGTRLLPSSDELAKVLRESVSQMSYKEEKVRAMQFGKDAIHAMNEGGSSFEDLEMLVQHLLQFPKPHPDVIREC